jgi:hypothetical protein
VLGKFRPGSGSDFLNCGNKFRSMLYSSDAQPKSGVSLTWERAEDELTKGRGVVVHVVVVKSASERYLVKKKVVPS